MQKAGTRKKTKKDPGRKAGGVEAGGGYRELRGDDARGRTGTAERTAAFVSGAARPRRTGSEVGRGNNERKIAPAEGGRRKKRTAAATQRLEEAPTTG